MPARLVRVDSYHIVAFLVDSTEREDISVFPHSLSLDPDTNKHNTTNDTRSEFHNKGCSSSRRRRRSTHCVALCSVNTTHSHHSNEKRVHPKPLVTTSNKTPYPMCPTNHDSRSSTSSHWTSATINGGSLRHVDLDTGTNGWASPPGDLFHLRSQNYFTKRQKSPAGNYLLSPAGMDWLKSTSKLDNVLARPDNRVGQALRQAQAQGKSLKSLIFAINLQIPGKEHHSAVFYFATEDPVPSGSLLGRFIESDDSFRNQRFKLVNRIVKGPWIVKKAVGNYSACLLGKALTCNYHRGPNYFEIDVDIGSSAIANAILRLALGYVTSVTIDMGFVVEAQTEEELPERLIGAVRVCQMEMNSATVVDAPNAPRGGNKVNHHNNFTANDDDE